MRSVIVTATVVAAGLLPAGATAMPIHESPVGPLPSHGQAASAPASPSDDGSDALLIVLTSAGGAALFGGAVVAARHRQTVRVS
jgi:hypothetical protein